MADRNLITVLDAIVAIAPDLDGHFDSIKGSVMYAAPEIMYLHWRRAAAILTEYASDHPKSDDIAKIFSGQQ